jgi:hypothetical protein
MRWACGSNRSTSVFLLFVFLVGQVGIALLDVFLDPGHVGTVFQTCDSEFGGLLTRAVRAAFRISP